MFFAGFTCQLDLLLLKETQLFEGSAFVSIMFFAGFACNIHLLLLKETRDYLPDNKRLQTFTFESKRLKYDYHLTVITPLPSQSDIGK